MDDDTGRARADGYRRLIGEAEDGSRVISRSELGAETYAVFRRWVAHCQAGKLGDTSYHHLSRADLAAFQGCVDDLVSSLRRLLERGGGE